MPSTGGEAYLGKGSLPPAHKPYSYRHADAALREARKVAVSPSQGHQFCYCWSTGHT